MNMRNPYSAQLNPPSDFTPLIPAATFGSSITEVISGYSTSEVSLIVQVKFELKTDHVRLVDYVRDPLEHEPMETWGGIEALIDQGAEGRFGEGTEVFLREANERQSYMRQEILRRYGIVDYNLPSWG